MDQTAPVIPTVLRNDVPHLITSPTIIDQPISPPPPPPPSPAAIPQTIKPPHPSHFGSLLAVFIIAISTFTMGLTGTVGYYKYFNDSIPLPNSESTGMLLGLTDTESTPVTPSPTPMPSTTLVPEEITSPLGGTLAYIKDHQIYSIKADRTEMLQLTSDDTDKHALAVSPDGTNLIYTYESTVPELTQTNSGNGIALLNRQTKEIKTIVEPEKVNYSNLLYSPSGKYASAWVNQGSESVIIDLAAAKIISRYGIPLDEGGVSPIVWLNGSDRVSFVLKNELFIADPDGRNITSLALDVLGLKPSGENQALPLPPIWSKNGQFVAFHRTTGLIILNPTTKQEIPVLSVPTALDPDKITWRAHAFTDSASHLIYEDYAAKDNQTTAVYSLLEKKNVSLSDIDDTILLNPSTNTLLGFPPKNTNERTLEMYSLTNWKMTSCPAADFRFIRPAILPAFNYPQPISPTGSGLIGLAQASGSLSTVKLINLTECYSYDLVKAPNITEVLWLPN